MKRLVIVLILMSILIGFIGFASAAFHAVCNPGSDPGIHGVYIDGVCYFCNNTYSDLVCPEDYGADCSEVGGDIDCEVEAQAFWSLNNITSISATTVNPDDGKNIFLVITGIENGLTINFHIWEEDDSLTDFIDDDIRVLSAVSSGGKAIATWKANKTDLNGTKTSDTDAFYFVATGTDIDESSNRLNITTTYTGDVVTQCSNYTSNTTCFADAESVGDNGVNPLRTEGSCLYNVTGYCTWNGTNCMQAINDTLYSGTTCSQGRGSCIYDNTETIGDCSVEDFFMISYTSSSTSCPAWTTAEIPCPSQVRLPFFSLFNIIASISIISIIYAFLLRKDKLNL